MERPDLVNSLIEIHKEKPVEFHEKHLMAMTVTNLLAGFDTMSATLSSIIVRTVRTEGCQARLQDEIDIATKVGRLSETPTYDETVQLHYLQACMWEGARMHGVIGVTLPRVVPEKGVEIDGYFLPGGVSRSWYNTRYSNIDGDPPDHYRDQSVGDSWG
jgi:cytochrome P450